MAFQEANQGGRYDRVIKGAQEFLKATQIDEGEGKTRDDPSYGGVGLRRRQQPAGPVEHVVRRWRRSATRACRPTTRRSRGR